MIIKIKEIILEEDLNHNDIAAIGLGIGAGGYLLHKGITETLPQKLGLRTEYHTTSKENAKNINKTGYLDPAFGGENGAAEKIGNTDFIAGSIGYNHITGPLKKNITNEDINASKRQSEIYKILYNSNKNFNNLTKSEEDLALLKSNIPILSNSKTFVIMEPNEYYNGGRFEVDSDSSMNALKTPEKIRVYNNKYEAIINNLKNRGSYGNQN